MLQSGFKDCPVSRVLVFGIISTSLAASIFDIKYYFYILVDPHLWAYRQIWRILIYQFAYTNSSEVLFAAIVAYNMRIIERLWGSRKFLSFLVLGYVFATIIPPFLLVFVLRPLSFGALNYLPAGTTPLLFSLLAQYHAVIPHVYKYRLVSSPHPSVSPNAPFQGATFSDKSYTYLLALQLSLSQFPGSFLTAVVGWAVGYMWRNEALSARLTDWRVPGWVVGEEVQKRGEGFEGLRRRLEGESANSTASGAEGRNGEPGRRRTIGRQLLDQFRGAP